MMNHLLLSSTIASILVPASIAQAQDTASVAAAQDAIPARPAQSVDPDSTADTQLEIVVTAQRRSERLQDVPMAVTALDGEILQRGSVVNLIDIQSLVPNLNIGPRLGSGVVAIRGIGFGILTAGAEGSVALHTDRVYQSRPFAALSGLYDIDRIEVARGPQGTLYGRNATGGAINIITRRPTQHLSGLIDLVYGNYNSLQATAAISGPLVSDRLLARVAVNIAQRDGYGKNLTTGLDIDDLKSRAVRGTLEFRPSDTVTLVLRGDYAKEDDASGTPHYVGCLATCNPNAATQRGWPLPTDPRDVFNDRQTINRPEDYGASLAANIEFPFANFATVSAYRQGSLFYVTDWDGTAQPGSQISREENYHTFSQELQLSNRSSAWEWLIGLYYFTEHNRARANGEGPPFLAGVLADYFQGGVLDTHAYAAFGELSHHVTPSLTLTVGGRYSYEKKHISEEYTYLLGPTGPITARQSAPTAEIPCTTCLGLPDRVTFKSFTPKVNVRYEFDRDHQVYVAVQKGFKSGGFAIGAVGPAFEPESIWSYEAGLKARWFDRRLTTNLAVYHYDYSDLQLGQVLTTATIVTNAAKAKVDGVELEWRLDLGDHVSLDGFGAYNHARFTSFASRNPGITASPLLDLSGNLLPNAPKWTARIAAEARARVFAGEVTARGELFTSSRVYFSEFNDAANSESPYSIVNANVRYDGPDRWYLGLYMNNVFDKTVASSGFVYTALFGAPVMHVYLPPRTFGVRVGKNF